MWRRAAKETPLKHLEQMRVRGMLLTSETYLFSLQGELRIVSREFFRNTAIGARFTTKSMVDYSAIQKFLTKENLHFFTLYRKAGKPVKSVIRHLPGIISAEDVTVALHEMVYDVISVKHDRQTSHFRRMGRTHLPPPLSGHHRKEPESSRNFQTDNTL
jgi:hypothetical protein